MEASLRQLQIIDNHPSLLKIAHSAVIIKGMVATFTSHNQMRHPSQVDQLPRRLSLQHAVTQVSCRRCNIYTMQVYIRVEHRW